MARPSNLPLLLPMTRLLRLLLLLSLTLLTAACKKDAPKPEASPVLEGTWQEQAYQEVITYNDDGTVRGESGPITVTNPPTYSFTGSTLTIKRDGTTYGFTYTRQGNQVSLLATDRPSPDPYEMTIAHLTKTELILHHKLVYQQIGGYSITVFHFTRK